MNKEKVIELLKKYQTDITVLEGWKFYFENSGARDRETVKIDRIAWYAINGCMNYAKQIDEALALLRQQEEPTSTAECRKSCDVYKDWCKATAENVALIRQIEKS